MSIQTRPPIITSHYIMMERWMKILGVILSTGTWVAMAFSTTPMFRHTRSISSTSSSSSLSMVLEKPREKTLAKIETLKIDSNHLIHPLKEVCFFPRFCLIFLCDDVEMIECIFFPRLIETCRQT
jgi:hypothetical protein